MALGLQARRPLAARDPPSSPAVAEQLHAIRERREALHLEFRARRETRDQGARLIAYDPPPVRSLPAGAYRSAPAPGEGNTNIRNPRSQNSFDTSTRINTFEASLEVRMPLGEMAPMVDPRGWGNPRGVIRKAYRVQVDDHGEYAPYEGDGAQPLGTRWRGKRPWLLFEYARTDIVSFENILEIFRFEIGPKRIRVEYGLRDCLKCMLGFLALTGGLQLNEGSIEITPMGDEWSKIDVTKRVRARDFTPREAGETFDTGQWINTTIGAALTLWVDDLALLSSMS